MLGSILRFRWLGLTLADRLGRRRRSAARIHSAGSSRRPSSCRLPLVRGGPGHAVLAPVGSTSRALALTFGWLLLLNIGYLLAYVPMSSTALGLTTGLGVMPWLLFKSLFSPMDLASFREFLSSPRSANILAWADQAVIPSALGVVFFAAAAAVLTHRTFGDSHGRGSPEAGHRAESGPRIGEPTRLAVNAAPGLRSSRGLDDPRFAGYTGSRPVLPGVDPMRSASSCPPRSPPRTSSSSAVPEAERAAWPSGWAASSATSLVRTGEMLRAAIRRQDFLGKRVEAHLAIGELVPDPLIFELLEAQPHRPRARDKLLFDGFPRTMGQVPLARSSSRRKLGFVIGGYLEIAVSHAEAVARMTGRRVCPVCGATYHLIGKPPRVAETCDLDGAAPGAAQGRHEGGRRVPPEGLRRIRRADPRTITARKPPSASSGVNGEQPFEEVYAETVRTLGLS